MGENKSGTVHSEFSQVTNKSLSYFLALSVFFVIFPSSRTSESAFIFKNISYFHISKKYRLDLYGLGWTFLFVVIPHLQLQSDPNMEILSLVTHAFVNKPVWLSSVEQKKID